MNRLCRKIDRNGTVITYTYNLHGNLVERRAGKEGETVDLHLEKVLWRKYGRMLNTQMDWYNDPVNCKPELSSNNRSHKYE